MAKSKSSGDLIAELKAHRGLASLRKITTRSIGSTTLKHGDDDDDGGDGGGGGGGGTV